MEYTLVTKNGNIMQFYIRATADLYKSLYGGVVITQQLLENETIAENHQ